MYSHSFHTNLIILSTHVGWNNYMYCEFCLHGWEIIILVSSSVWQYFHRAKLPQPGCHVAVVTGKRYTAKEARDAGFINEVSLDNYSKLVERAVHLGEELSQSDVDRIFLSDYKHDLYHSLCYSLKQSPVVISHIWYTLSPKFKGN